MKTVLATAWNPRGELARLQRYADGLVAIYDHIVVTLVPEVDDAVLKALDRLPLEYHVTEKWGTGRHLCLEKALATPADFIHYVDTDRLIRWVELRPEELEASVAAIRNADFMVIGRTPSAWDTHPRAMYETEAIINETFSRLLGQAMDFGAGSKGMSRRAAQFLIRHISPDDAFDMDAAWAVLLHRAGFDIHGMTVDGLDWETADRNRDQAADAETQRQLAYQYDQDAERWAMRVDIARKIIKAGIGALNKPLEGIRYLEIRRHTMRVKPGQRLSQPGVELARRIGRNSGPFDRVITSTIPRAYETAVAMGYAVDEQYDELNMMIEGVENEVGSWDAGFAAYGQALRKGGLTSTYGAKLAAFYRSVLEALPDGGKALVVTHGGVVEAGAVACMPDADHSVWGRSCSYCEGVRLMFDGKNFTNIEILRLNSSSTS
jgi:broad specificity phosphatase PhoE